MKPVPAGSAFMRGRVMSLGGNHEATSAGCTSSRTVVHEDVLPVSASRVWGLLVDWGGIGTWFPGSILTVVRMEGEGVGAVRHLKTSEGDQISERLDDLDAHSKRLELSIVGNPPWKMSRYKATATITDLGSTQCRIHYCGRFETAADDEQAERIARKLRASYSNLFRGLRNAAAESAP